MCIPPFLCWQPLSSIIDDIGGKISWTLPISWYWWFAVSTLGYLCWRWMSVQKVQYLWTPPSRRQSSSLLRAQILSPFVIAGLNGLGVMRGNLSPSLFPHFHWDRFRLSPCRSWKKLQDHLYRGHLSKTCKLVHQWLQDDWLYQRDNLLFSAPSTAVHLLKVLGFVRTFRFLALALGWFPSLVGNCQVCAVTQMRSPSVLYITRPELLARGVCAGLPQGSTPRRPYFHWSINVIRSGIILSALRRSWEVLVSRSTWELP